MTRTVADHLIDIMLEAGIQHVYGVVGDSANPVADAIRGTDGKLSFIHVRNEEAGAFAAGADAQIFGRPTAVLGSSGPGSLHLLNGLYDCDRNGAPVFAVVTHIPSTEIGTGYSRRRAQTSSSWITRGTSGTSRPRPRCLGSPSSRCRRRSLERGVGMVILPGDIAAMEVDAPLLAHPLATDQPEVRLSDADLDKLAELIGKSRKIAVYAGDGSRAARSEALRLYRLLHAPIGYPYRGKDIFDADNPERYRDDGSPGRGRSRHCPRRV